MSDEEEIDGKIKVSLPHWRSTEFNEFMDTLDSRASASINNSIHPRRDMFLGYTYKGDAPVGAPDKSHFGPRVTSNVILIVIILFYYSYF